MDSAALALVVAETAAKEVPDVTDFVLNILCDTNAEPFFAGDDTSADELYRGVAMRNAHLESDTGAYISVSTTADFYTAAKNDILSGSYLYDLYAASASDSLARLMADGSLLDVSNSDYIDTDAGYYDKKTMKSLSLYGGMYLISSSAADARWWSTATVYDTAFVNRDEVVLLALDGGFTVGEMLACGDLLYARDDVYPLFFGMGGYFARTAADGCKFISLSDFGDAVDKVSQIPENNLAETDAFALHTLYEVRGNERYGILPLPKADEYDEYGGYIDLEKAVMLAIPKGSPVKDKTEYLVDVMASFSDEYVRPYFEAPFADREMYDIITDAANTDLSVLLGYGDLGSLVADCMRDGTRLTLEYYNRKALYEKAFDIIAKRLCLEE